MKHILEIARFLKKFNLHDGQELKLDQSRNQKNELTTLADSINQLKSDLSSTSTRLKELNLDLEKSN